MLQADGGKKLGQLGFSSGGFAADFLVQAVGFDDLAADIVQGVERGHRLLKNHADVAAADARDVGFAEARNFAIIECDLPIDFCVTGQEFQDGKCGKRFA